MSRLTNSSRLAGSGGASDRRVLDTLGAIEVLNPDWSSDGRRLVYENYTEDPEPHAAVIVANADGSGARELSIRR
jgi:Tol biopolymer transport system component